MAENAEERIGWLSLHERLAMRVRRGVLLLTILAAAGAADGLAHIEHQKERYLFARQFAQEVSKAPRAGAKTLYDTRCSGEKSAQACQSPSDDSESGKLIARLEEIPEVRLEYDLFLERAHPDRMLRLWNLEVRQAAYVFVILYGPLVLLVLIYLRLSSMRGIASRLRDEAVKNGPIQQRLNSIFSDRVTTELGERRLSYSLLWAFVLFLLGFAPHILLLTWQASFSTNTYVSISADGVISTLSEVPRIDRVIQWEISSHYAAESVVYFMIVLVLTAFTWIVVFNQLGPPRVVEVNRK